MAINVELENLVPLSEAGELFPKTPCMASLYRWASPRGVRGRCLETAFIGGRRYTSREAVKRFMTPQYQQVLSKAQAGSERVLASRSARAAAAHRHGI
ncbi:MAG: hypothetical protein JWP89_5199 [Schlesneria sp.]|nr:hypothetical protein [Schlesneria sp.]